jgi:hypothetical protein
MVIFEGIRSNSASNKPKPQTAFTKTQPPRNLSPQAAEKTYKVSLILALNPLLFQRFPMSKPSDPSDDRNKPSATNPALLTLLCAVLVGLATWTIFLVR